MRGQTQTLTLIPWKGFILIFTFFKGVRKNMYTAQSSYNKTHYHSPAHTVGHWASSPWTSRELLHISHSTFPGIYLLSNVSFSLQWQCLCGTRKGKVPGFSRSQTWIYKEQVNKTKEHWGRRHVSDTRFPSVARSCHAFTYLVFPLVSVS